MTFITGAIRQKVVGLSFSSTCFALLVHQNMSYTFSFSSNV
ncbi:MAG: hypothetical protein WC446_04725 [Candidatus Paceibacterota bacterium]